MVEDQGGDDGGRDGEPEEESGPDPLRHQQHGHDINRAQSAADPPPPRNFAMRVLEGQWIWPKSAPAMRRDEKVTADTIIAATNGISRPLLSAALQPGWIAFSTPAKMANT